MALLMSERGFNKSDSSFNQSMLENSSFIMSTDSEADSSTSMNSRRSVRTPLKLPDPSFGHLTSTPFEKMERKEEESLLPTTDVKPPSPSGLPKPLFDKPDLEVNAKSRV